MSQIRVALFLSIVFFFLSQGNGQAPWVSRGGESPSIAINAISRNSSQIVAVSNTERYLTSVDGITWTQRNLPSRNKLHAIAWSGTQFVAVGGDSAGFGVTMTSPDGISWTKRNVETAQEFVSILSTGTLLVAVDRTGRFFNSADGITWNSKKVLDTLESFGSMVWTGSQIVVVGSHQEDGYQTGIVLSSPDGKNWTYRNAGKVGGLKSIAWTGTRIIAGTGDGFIITSLDAITWTMQAYVAKSFYAIVATGSQIIVLGKGVLSTSTDGLTWTEQSPTGLPLDYRSVIYWTGSQFIAINERGLGFSSSDGIAWTAIKDLTPPPQEWYAVASTGSKHLVVGKDGAMASSTDGIIWTPRISGTKNLLRSISWNGSQFIVVGDSGTILSSPDGMTWTSRSSGTLNSLKAITWTGTYFVTVGVAGSILTSPDGITWTSRKSEDSSSLNCIAWNGKILVAGGIGNMAQISPDGITWTPRTLPSGGTYISIVWTGSQFVFALNKNAKSRIASIITSPDGITWNTKPNLPGNVYTSLYAMTWSGSELVAVGTINGFHFFTSADGTTWKHSPANRQLNAITWTGSQLIAVGAYDAIYMTPAGPVTGSVGRSSVPKKLALRVSQESLSLPLPEDMLGDKIKLRVYSLNGHKVLDIESPQVNGALIIPTSKLTRGRYVLEVKGSNRSISKSFCLIQ